MSGTAINGVPIAEIIQPLYNDPAEVERIAHRKVKGPEIAILEPDPHWPDYFQLFRSRILAAFDQDEPEGNTTENAPSSETTNISKVIISAINHVGSTSVPGLPAKAVIDIDLILTSATLPHEIYYVPRLESAGFQFLLREPAWHEHRFFAAHEPMSCNLHVFGPRCAEVERHRIFRDWLRGSAGDRVLYAEVKRESAKMARDGGENVTEYNVRKNDVIQQIYGRAFWALGFYGGK
ncbi:hypothetical protein LTR62_003815 [Meristemomyces frigidus]|uniref:GrpB domain protein n=1 Tax=Meristemomyces frigidus TaxID=1508187 RepID=A0AAN7TRB5_9PEZI|nr:hypothetical protein LTR62_003815 [Meristemomyces frigidus]